jgi:anti-sigma factor RsiW
MTESRVEDAEMSSERETQTMPEDMLELLPWYVNGTLTDKERERVERFLDQQPEYRTEVDLLRAARGQVQRTGDGNSPGSLGWKRLQRQIEQESGDDAKGADSPSWWRPAMAAALVVIVFQGVLLLQQQSTVEPLYQPLSGPEAPGARLQVSFVPSTGEQEIRTLLLELGLVVVDGPSASGIYRLKAVDGTEGSLQAAEQALRQSSRVISHVAREE